MCHTFTFSLKVSKYESDSFHFSTYVSWLLYKRFAMEKVHRAGHQNLILTANESSPVKAEVFRYITHFNLFSAFLHTIHLS